MALGFHNVQFPTDVSYGSSGGPVFKTQIFEAYRGLEKRNIEWAQPMMEFNVAYGIKTDTQMLNVLEFYNARQGPAYGFRYKNWGNYNIVNAPFAVGDGVSTRLPIWKFYGFQGARQYKRLRKIVQGTVTGVGIGGVGTLVEGTDYSINYDEGEIALSSAPGYGIPVFCSNLEFDEPVRFEEDDMQAMIDGFNNQSLNQVKLVSIRTPFSTGAVFAPNASNTAADSFYENTALILNFDDVTNLTTTVDQSQYANPVTFAGTATLSRTAFYSGNGSFSAGDGRITLGGGVFNLSPLQPFTLEFFARQPPTTGGSDQQMIIGKWEESTNQRCWTVRYVRATKELQFVVSSNGTDERIILNYSWDLSQTNAFDYISIDRLTNGWHIMRINGIVVAQVQDNAVVHDAPLQVLSIGQIQNPSATQGPYNALIDSIRMTVGRSRYNNFNNTSIPTPYPTEA